MPAKYLLPDGNLVSIFAGPEVINMNLGLHLTRDVDCLIETVDLKKARLSDDL